MTTPPEPDLRAQLADASHALRAVGKAAITVQPTLDTPYPDDPRWTPWTRWVRDPARRAYNLGILLHRQLGLGPQTHALHSTTATRLYDAARQQTDATTGHTPTCQWHTNGHSYCSCPAYGAACAGVDAALQALDFAGADEAPARPAPAPAEAVIARAREISRRLAAHAAGFQDALDDTDRSPWGKTVGADLTELLAALGGGSESAAAPLPDLRIPPGAVPATRAVLNEVGAERIRRTGGEQNHPDGTGGAFFTERADAARRACQAAAAQGTLTWRHILEEKFKEATAETSWSRLRTELVQIAAVAVAWTEAGDRRAAGQQTIAHPSPAGDE